MVGGFDGVGRLSAWLEEDMSRSVAWRGMENNAAKAAARSGDISGGLRKESDGLRKRERG